MPSIASTYWWQGKVEQAGEALHSYSVPEVIALPLVGGNPDYLRWIDESVRAPEPRR